MDRRSWLGLVAAAGIGMDGVARDALLGAQTAARPGRRRLRDQEAFPDPDLPRAHVDVRYTAPTGRSLPAGNSRALQRALNTARPGDEILLDPATVYTGNFRLPERGPFEGYTVLRTDHAGFAPDRPGRIRRSDAEGFAVLQTPNVDNLLHAESGTSGWRVMDVTLRPEPRLRSMVYDLVWLGGNERSVEAQPSYIILDRILITAGPDQPLKRGVRMEGRHQAVIRSIIEECKSTEGDSQSIAGHQGAGPLLIEDCAMYAAGENLMFGGGDPPIRGQVATDFTIRRVFMSRPAAWGIDPGSVPWVIKTPLELKVGLRGLIEGLVIENTGIAGHSGTAVHFKSTNQDGGCPTCATQHVTFRRSLIRNAPQVFNFSGRGDTHRGGRTSDLLIEDVLCDRIGKYSDYRVGNPRIFTLLADPKNWRFRRITALNGAGGGGYPLVMAMGARDGEAADGFDVSSCIFAGIDPGFDATPAGTTSLRRFAPNGTYDKVLLAWNPGEPTDQAPLPKGWWRVGNIDQVRFRDWQNGDYRLRQDSQFHGFGADIEAVEEATRGVAE